MPDNVRMQRPLVDLSAAYLVTDTCGVIREVNRAAAQLLQTAPTQLIGRTLSSLLDKRYRRSYRQLLPRLRQSGAHEVWDACLWPSPAMPLALQFTATNIRDWNGGALLIRWQMRGTSAQRQTAAQSPMNPGEIGIVATALATAHTSGLAAAQTVALLTQVNRTFAEMDDIHSALAEVVRLSVPLLGELGVVDVDKRGVLRRVAVACGDHGRAERVCELQAHYRPKLGDSHPVFRALQSGQAQLAHHVPESLLEAFAADSRQLEILHALKLAAFLAVPLRAQGHIHGVLWFFSAQPARYTDDDRVLAEALADRCACALTNAHRIDELQAAVRARQSFLAVAVHELRTSFTGMTVAVELLNRRLKPESRLAAVDQHTLSLLAEQARRLRGMVETLLDMSRIDANQLAIASAAVDLYALVHHVGAEFQPTLTKHTLTVLGEREPVIVAGDRERLTQVLHNLIQNAIVYSPDGGAITVKLEQREDAATVSVSDQGIGISPSTQARLFERFYRGDSAAEQHVQGMGIGLYVVQEIVARHGGTVTVTSVEGQGSVFTVCLPRQPFQAREVGGAASATPQYVDPPISTEQ